MTDKEVMQQALDALELVTANMLDCRDQLAERGGRPTTNVVHQRLWDAAHKTYTDNAIPVAEALRARLAQGEPEPVAWRIRCTEPMRDWVLMYRQPSTEEKFSNMEIQPLYTKPHSAAHSADSAESFCKPGPMSCSVSFPRHTPKHGEDWVIDPAFLLRVYHSIDPDAHYGFIPTMEEIETAFLALEVIPSNIWISAPPQHTWQGLTDEEIRTAAFLGIYEKPLIEFARAIEAKLKEKNGY